MNKSESDSANQQLAQTDKKYPEKTNITLDMEGVDEILKQTIPPMLFSENNDALLEATTNGMQQSLEKLQAIETTLTVLTARVERLETQVRQDTRAVGIEVANLRNDLLGDRKVLSALSVFNGVISTLDSLHILRTVLAEDVELPAYRQVVALIDSLTMALRSLGFVEFQVSMGEPFDPSTMECIGYTHGQAGVVLGVSRSGYKTQAGVVRPVGVLIADPSSPT